MGSEFEIPKVGKFQLKDHAWEAQSRVPAFEIFTFIDETLRLKDPKLVDLDFEILDSNDPPSADKIELLNKVLANAEKLAATVKKAIWADLKGKEPETGMWWHDSLEDINEDADEMELPKLKKADSLHDWLRLNTIRIRERLKPDAPLIAELVFDSGYELEHGIGVLTDGVKVLGIGYACSVRLFEE